MRQSTALHVTRRNHLSVVVPQATNYCVDRDADLRDVVADPPRLPGWERVVGDGRHLPEERPAVLDQLVSNPLAFSGSPHATLRFPKLPRRGCETTAGSTEGWSDQLAFRIAGELWRRRDERTPFGPSRRDSNPCFSLERASPWVVISPTSLPGATARCHSKPRSALSGPDPQRSHRGISSEILRRGSPERGALQQFLARCEPGSPVAVETMGHAHSSPAINERSGPEAPSPP